MTRTTPGVRASLRTHDKTTHIVIRRGSEWSVKLRITEATALADQLIDLVEQHEKGKPQ